MKKAFDFRVMRKRSEKSLWELCREGILLLSLSLSLALFLTFLNPGC